VCVCARVCVCACAYVCVCVCVFVFCVCVFVYLYVLLSLIIDNQPSSVLHLLQRGKRHTVRVHVYVWSLCFVSCSFESDLL